MRILVSNDDGVHAEGILRLSEALTACGEVIVVAPDRNRSGASHSLTLEVLLRVTRLAKRRMAAVSCGEGHPDRLRPPGGQRAGCARSRTWWWPESTTAPTWG